MTDWLAGLGEDELGALLGRRDDALLAPQPRTLSDVSARLQHPTSLAAVLQRLPLPCVQACEALAALGESPERAELVELLGSDGDTVGRWLTVLVEHGIVWPGTDDTLCCPDTLGDLFGDPLRLGPVLRTVVADVPVATLRSILSTIGVTKPPTRRAEVLEEIHRVLGDPQLVRDLVGTAPSAVGDTLRAWACDGTDEDDDFYVPARYDPARIQARMTAARWGAERGIVFGGQWSHNWQMPAEVTRALRGADYHAPFDAAAPDVPVTVLDAANLAAQSAGAVGRFAELTLEIADHVARTPVPMLKSGGVGARELTKLRKHCGCTDLQARLVLELGAAAGVFVSSGRVWLLGEDGRRWRGLAPAARIAPLLLAWWLLPLTPGEARDADGKAIPALAERTCVGCLHARQAVIGTLAGLGAGASAAIRPLARRTLWRRPFVHVFADEGREPFDEHLGEAAALGIVAGGALTELGTAVLVEDTEKLHTLLTQSLPEASDSALFGADLTAVVPGAPNTTVARLLDAAADRESRGGATVWRFSPASVRRALDAGHAAEALTRELGEIASGGELPQPLRYLIGDIGRAHGNLRVAAATSVIRAQDEALLAQVAADRSLRVLNLRLLAPTVLAADADTVTVLTKLRSAGYLPMPELGGSAGDPEAVPSEDLRTADQYTSGGFGGLDDIDGLDIDGLDIDGLGFDDLDDVEAELLRTLGLWADDEDPADGSRAAEPVDAATLAARLLTGPPEGR